MKILTKNEIILELECFYQKQDGGQERREIYYTKKKLEIRERLESALFVFSCV